MTNPIKRDRELLRSIVHDLRSSFGVISGLASMIPLAENEMQRNAMLSRLQVNVAIANSAMSELLSYTYADTAAEVPDGDGTQADL